VQLPQEMLESIIRRTIIGETPRASARQLALLQRVDQGFRAAARSVLHSRDQQEVGRETTRAQIERLASHSTPDEFAAGMRSIVGNAPDVSVRLRSLPDHFQETALQVLAEQTHLRSLELDAKGTPDIAPDAVAAMQEILPKNPQLHRADLNLNRCNLTRDDVNTIANSASLKSLTSLDIGNNDIDDDGALALANSEHLRLRSLELRGNSISDAGVTALANSDKLAALSSLDLGNNAIDDDGALALANSERLRLQSLELRGNRICDAGVTALANSEIARSLKSLGLRNNLGISPDGVITLANSDKLSGLASLDLRGNYFVGNEGAIALANSRHLRLMSLDLGGCSISDRGAAILARSDTARSLTSLGLQDNDLGDWGARTMARIGRLDAEIFLNLLNNRISEEGARALSARFKHVVV
jgi:Leucine-rich repeat (LRR) protein